MKPCRLVLCLVVVSVMTTGNTLAELDLYGRTSLVNSFAGGRAETFFKKVSGDGSEDVKSGSAAFFDIGAALRF